ncbi:MAG TPA: DUF1570 domain-containing protein [Thermoanaerobaculia bacterium]|nr:DUF1570 domain-containing protein [Thermoanaerobaculia bacterium]
MRFLALSPFLALLTTASASAQFVPPVPKGVAGETVIHERPIPLPHAEQQWIRAASPSFTLISSADETRTKQIAETLETVAGALRRVHPRFDARFTDTTVFVFNRRRDSQPYFELLLNQPRTTAPGAFVVQSNGTAAIVIDSGRPLATDRTVKHELMHNILAASGTRLPLWLEEGIAEYFSTTVVRGDSVIIGRPIISHYRLLRLRGVLPVEDILGARHGAAAASHPLFYPQCWALVEWMMRTKRQAFYSFVADVDEGANAAVAFRRHFGMEIGTVTRSFRMTASRPSASSNVQIERTPIPVATRSISASDALYELGRFLGGMINTRDDAERYLRAALALDPAHARSVAGIGTLRAYERKYDEAEPFFDDALELAPDDSVVRALYAEALLQNAIGPFAGAIDVGRDAVDRFRRARTLIESARALEPSPLADAILGTTYLVEDDVTAGIEPLERARAERPARLDFALNLYALYVRAGREADAGALFQSTFQRSKNTQAVFAARAVYVRERMRKANQLVAARRFEDAAAVIKELIDVTPDETAKADLRLEYDKLMKVATVNREIETYNEAVNAYNGRELHAALERLDHLLTVATDDEIRGKAERLRTTVRRRLGM